MRSPRVVAVVAVGAAACGGPGRSVPSPATVDATPRRGPIPRVLVPAQLGDAGVLDRIPWGARLIRRGAYRFTLAEPPDDLDRRGTEADIAQVWPVIAETTTEIQLVSEIDRARLAIWVARVDVATVAIDDVAVALAPRGDAPPTHRAVIRAGAPIHPGPADGDHRKVILGGDVQVTGWIPDAWIGSVFRVARRAETGSEGRLVRPGAKLRAGPSRGAPVLATLGTALRAQRHAGAPAGWYDVTVTTPYARVRGFVPAADVDEAYGYGGGGIGGSIGYGTTNRVRLAVPAGACLFADPEGEVVGVNLESITRYARETDQKEWWGVTVASDWGMHELFVRDRASSGNPQTATIELCTEDVTAR